ncbi:MAG: dephospho-CoA kinase, partial [Enterococcus casseliflavus]
MSFVLGVTGGIATGKSTAVAHFRSLGLPIIDADIIAREVVEPNTEGLQAVTQAFGPQILTDDGHLNRQTLGALIFNDPEKRRLLNQTLSPFIRQEILSQIEEKKQQVPLLIVDIPLLYEAD